MAKIKPQRQKEKHSVIIDIDKCKGCSLCVAYCPVGHLEISTVLNKRGVAYAQKKINTFCTGCGNCFFICPECCLQVRPSGFQREEKKYDRQKNKKK